MFRKLFMFRYLCYIVSLCLLSNFHTFGFNSSQKYYFKLLLMQFYTLKTTLVKMKTVNILYLLKYCLMIDSIMTRIRKQLFI